MVQVCDTYTDGRYNSIHTKGGTPAGVRQAAATVPDSVSLVLLVGREDFDRNYRAVPICE